MRRLVALFMVVVIVAGCSVASSQGVDAAPSTHPSRSAVVIDGTSPTPTTAPTPASTLGPAENSCPPIPTEPPAMPDLPPDVDEATREAIRQRIEYGLRHDLFCVEHVATQPSANMSWGFPMLPSEEADIWSRNTNPEAMTAALQRYGHTDEFGGLRIEQSLGGVYVIAWTGNLARHEAGIRAELPPCHPVLFRQVRWSEAELREWQDRVVADSEWLEDIPAAPHGVGADLAANVVEIDISSANPAAADIIVAHYGAPPGMLRVMSDGTGAALLPWGTVRGTVRTADGKPVKLADVTWSSDDPGDCGGGDVGYSTGDTGTFEVGCQVGRRTIRIVQLGPNGMDDATVLGEGTVQVVAGQVSALNIVAEAPAP